MFISLGHHIPVSSRLFLYIFRTWTDIFELVHNDIPRTSTVDLDLKLFFLTLANSGSEGNEAKDSETVDNNTKHCAAGAALH